MSGHVIPISAGWDKRGRYHSPVPRWGRIARRIARRLAGFNWALAAGIALSLMCWAGIIWGAMWVRHAIWR